MAKYEDYRSPLEVVKQMRLDFGWDRANQVSFEYFNNKYFKPLPSNESKIIKSFKYLIPGRFYTFRYDPMYKDDLSFYDKRPVMMCIKNYIHPKTNNNLQLGLNLNFIPPEIRIFILTGIWKWFKAMIQRDLQNRDPENEAVGRQKLLFTDNFDVYALLDYVLETVGNTGWKFAIRQYIWERIDDAKIIDYDDLGYIPLLHSKDLIGTSERELYKIYWKNKNRGKLK